MVEELDRVVVALWGRWRQEFEANNSAKADEIETKIDEIAAKREKAKKELEEAKKELKEAEQKYDAKASVQAGRGPGGFCVQLLLLTLVCSTPACVFVRSTVCAFWGSALSKGHLVVKLHCVGLQPFGEREGLLAALGSCKSGCPSCFADPSERGVSPRLEVGGSACFALALTGCWCWQ